MLAAPREDLPRLAVLAAACRFNLGEFSAAERAIVEGAPPDSSWSTLALLGMCAAARGDWSAAQARLAISQRKSPGPGPARSLARLGEAAAAGSELPHRAPRLAMALSAIVPGGGQVYAGHAADGVRHLLFNAALIATVVQFAADGKPGAAYVTASVAAPFYLGNVLGARAAARQFNRDRRLAHLARAAARAETGLEQARRP